MTERTNCLDMFLKKKHFKEKYKETLSAHYQREKFSVNLYCSQVVLLLESEAVLEIAQWII